MVTVLMACGVTPSCVIDLVPSRVQWGLTVSDGPKLPVVEFRYTLEALAQLSLIGRALQERGVVPEVYIWDEGGADLEIAALYDLRLPSRKELDLILGEAYPMLGRVLALSSASIPSGPYYDEVMRVFKKSKKAAFVITEVCENDPKSTQLGEVVQVFEIAAVHEHKPVLGPS